MKRLTFQLYNPKRDKKILKRTGLVIVAITVLAFWGSIIFSYYFLSDLFREEAETPAEEASLEEDCNVVVGWLEGGLYASKFLNEGEELITEDQLTSDELAFIINEVENDDKIKAFVLKINSWGGTPFAAEEVANALKRAKKPTVAFVQEFGLSSAYYAATGADIIFASANSDVGGIGVTQSYSDYSKKNQAEGITYNLLSSGQFKDAGSENKPLTSEEKELLMRDINIAHENFVKAVAENRNLDIEKVRELADGSSMLGQMALDNGLIDRIGGLYEVKEYLKEKIGEEVKFCR